MSSLMASLVAFQLVHSLPAVLLFLAALAVVFFLFTMPSSAASLRSAARLAWTGLCTPFEFIRNSFAVMNAALKAEKDYAGTREFVLFRYSRIQYLLACIFAVLFLAGAATRTVLALWPAAEMDRHRQLKAQLDQLNRDLQATQKNIDDASRPDYTQKMVAERDKWQRIYNQQIESDANFRPKIVFTSPILSQIDATSDPATLNQIDSQMDVSFSNCPGDTWFGFTIETCNSFKSQLKELIQRKLREQRFLQNVQSANLAIQNNGATLASFREHYSQVTSQITSTQQEMKEVDPTSGKVLGRHFFSALLVAIGSIMFFVVTVWVYAMFIDVFNWLVMMMRSLEKRHSEDG